MAIVRSGPGFVSARRVRAAAVAAVLVAVTGWGVRGADPPARDDAFAAAVQRVDAATVGISTGRERTARGAGFVWRAGGAIVTAAHVVAGASEIAVRLADGREVAARLVGADDVADVALLSIAEDPPPAPLAPAGTLRRGDEVAAIGDPLGFAGTLTVGHVSSPARRWGETSPFDLVQHDAALNPGSSGGPLVDRDGRVVGMNLAIADGARRHVGIGFALPIEVVERVAGRLGAEGSIARPRLGLRVRAAAALTLGAGLAIEAVDPGSAAAAGGLAPGDVILAADGTRLETAADLARLLEGRRPGETLRLRLAGEAADRGVALARAPSPTRRLARAPTPFAPGFTLAGGGGRVETVAEGGPAAAAGLSAGDEILAIGARRLGRDDAGTILADAVAADGASGLSLLVRRGEVTRWIVLGPAGRLDAEAPFGSNAEARDSRYF